MEPLPNASMDILQSPLLSKSSPSLTTTATQQTNGQWQPDHCHEAGAFKTMNDPLHTINNLRGRLPNASRSLRKLRLSQLLTPRDGQLLVAATSTSITPAQPQVGPQEGNDRPDLPLLDTSGVRLKVRHVALLQPRR